MGYFLMDWALYSPQTTFLLMLLEENKSKAIIDESLAVQTTDSKMILKGSIAPMTFS